MVLDIAVTCGARGDTGATSGSKEVARGLYRLPNAHPKPGMRFFFSEQILGKHNRLKEISGAIITAITSLIATISLIVRKLKSIPKKIHTKKGSDNTIKLHVCTSSK